MLAYTHIPKTAGSTLTEILIKQYGSKLISIVPRNGKIYTYSNLKDDLKIYKNPSCIAGHNLKPFVDFKEFNDRMQWFTFLRDPVKTFISLYIHQFTGQNPKYKLEFSDWMTRFNRKNRMVNWIAGENNLEKAKEIIQTKIEFIGITEKFDESLILFKEKFNIRSISYVSKMKTQDPALKNQIMNNITRFQDQIMSNNDLDIELYQYALNKIFPRQIEDIGHTTFLRLLETKPNALNNEDVNVGKLNGIKYRLKRNLVYKPFVFFSSRFKNH